MDGDKGPFAGIPKDLEDAITRYGTPPYREMVAVSVRNVGRYSFDEMPTTPRGWIEWIARAIEDTPAQYRDKLNCVLSWEAGCYDSGDSAQLSVWYERLETDAEMTARVNRGINYVRRAAAKERARYEELKRKFESQS